MPDNGRYWPIPIADPIIGATLIVFMIILLYYKNMERVDELHIQIMVANVSLHFIKKGYKQVVLHALQRSVLSLYMEVFLPLPIPNLGGNHPTAC